MSGGWPYLLLVALWIWNTVGMCASSEYPSKPIHIIVPYSPGSSGDVRTRQVAHYLAGRLGQPVIVDNKPGASGTIGSRIAAQAPADGYTLLYMSNPRVIVPHLYKNVGIDVAKDLAPIALMVYGAAILVVTPNVPANSVKELVALAKARPDYLTYGSSGVGSVQHLPMEIFKRLAGIDVLHIPYKGDAETLNSLLGGQVSMSFALANSVLPHIKGGKLKALAVGGKQRMAMLPAVPTMVEAGHPEFEWHNWFGYAAPAGTPKTIIEKLNKEMVSFLALASVRRDFLDSGFDIAGGSPEEFGALIGKDLVRYGELIKRLGIQAEQ
ncbi:MAG: Bug family tripartite tricarboxylate transporter substrate binding protein [Burkholderiales bacterium]